MSFTSSLEMSPNGVAMITLSGELDASVAQIFRDQIQEAANKEAKRLALLVKDLNYMASAGLRVLIFAKQKMGSKVDLYVVEPQETILETITMTGFLSSVIVMPTYDANELMAI